MPGRQQQHNFKGKFWFLLVLSLPVFASPENALHAVRPPHVPAEKKGWEGGCRSAVVGLVGESLPRLSEARKLNLLDREQRRQSGFWTQIENQRDFILAIAEDLGVQSFGELYTLTIREIEERGGVTMLRRFENDLFLLFSTIFPDYRWNDKRLSVKGQKVSQRHSQLRAAIPQSRWLSSHSSRENFRSDKWRWPQHGRQMEVDFYFPQAQIVLEIQGEYHDRQNDARQRDELKRKLIEADGETAVLWIPSSWSGDPSDLDRILETEMLAADVRMGRD